MDAEEGGHNNSDEQRLEGKAEEIEKDETGSKNRSKRAATTEEQKNDSADSTRKVQKREFSKAFEGMGEPEKSESDKLLEKYFAGMHDYYNDFLLACALFNGSRFVIPITIIAFLSVFLLQ